MSADKTHKITLEATPPCPLNITIDLTRIHSSQIHFSHDKYLPRLDPHLMFDTSTRITIFSRWRRVWRLIFRATGLEEFLDSDTVDDPVRAAQVHIMLIYAVQPTLIEFVTDHRNARLAWQGLHKRYAFDEDGASLLEYADITVED